MQVSIISESIVIILIGFLLGVVLPTDGSFFSWKTGNVGVEEEGLAMAGVLNLCLGMSSGAKRDVLKGFGDAEWRSSPRHRPLKQGRLTV